MKEFLKEIEEIKIECSEPNWDGYVATPVNLKSIQYIIDFVSKLPKDIIPEASPLPNGRMGVEWNRKNGDSILISISEEGILYYTSLINNNSMMIEYDFGKKGMRKGILDMIINFNK